MRSLVLQIDGPALDLGVNSWIEWGVDSAR